MTYEQHDKLLELILQLQAIMNLD